VREQQSKQYAIHLLLHGFDVGVCRERRQAPYVDANGHLVYQAEGSRPRVVDTHGYEPSLRKDGKQLVYTRQISDSRPEYTCRHWPLARSKLPDT
jgi:hypothetical protein